MGKKEVLFYKVLEGTTRYAGPGGNAGSADGRITTPQTVRVIYKSGPSFFVEPVDKEGKPIEGAERMWINKRVRGKGWQ